jgi:hypothetical protein
VTRTIYLDQNLLIIYLSLGITNTFAYKLNHFIITLLKFVEAQKRTRKSIGENMRSLIIDMEVYDPARSKIGDLLVLSGIVVEKYEEDKLDEKMKSLVASPKRKIINSL